MRRSVVLTALFVGVSLEASAGSHDGAVEDPTVLRVGKVELHASELRYRFGKLHPFELESFATQSGDPRRGFVEQRLVPEVLLSEHARARGWDREPRVAASLRKRLGLALRDDLRRAADQQLTPKQIRAYCAREAVGEAKKHCARDRDSYRIALRRKLAAEELAELTASLKKRHLSGVDWGLLDQLVVTREGVRLAAAPTARPGAQPQQQK